MPWDTGTWDSGTWDSDLSPPNPNPKTKKKPMKHQDYFPTRIGDQIVWLRNLKIKLPGYSTTLALVAGDVTARLLDIDNVIYALESYRGGATAFQDAAYQRIDDVLFNADLPGTVSWLAFAAPASAPTAVAYGALRRVFDYISGTIKKAAAYDLAIGSDMGIEAAAVPAPDAATTTPAFTLRPAAAGKLEVVWTKGLFDGVKLQFDLGPAGPQTDVDLRPNYTLNWLPATGATAIVKVRLRYLYKGEEFGNWSAWQNWTLTGT